VIVLYVCVIFFFSLSNLAQLSQLSDNSESKAACVGVLTAVAQNIENRNPACTDLMNADRKPKTKSV